jgi:ABC-type antimicrobial peptide transport system permease subunit
VLVTVVPAALGLGLAWIAVAALAPKLSQLLPALYLQPKVIGAGLLIAVAIGVIAAALPVFETRRHRLSDLLR